MIQAANIKVGSKHASHGAIEPERQAEKFDIELHFRRTAGIQTAVIAQGQKNDIELHFRRTITGNRLISVSQ
jgi:hypothetical protein